VRGSRRQASKGGVESSGAETMANVPTRLRKLLLCRGTTLLLVCFTVCPVASLGQTNGPLRVHPENPRYFADVSGQAILLTGSHTWNNLVDIGSEDPPQSIDFDNYLRWLQKHGHNFTRGWTWEPTRWDTTAMRNEAWRNGNHQVSPHPWQRTGPGIALDGKPKFDLTQHNPAYLNQLRQRLARAREAGVYVSVMLFEGYGVQFQPDAWPNHPLNPANNVQGVDGDKDGDGKGIEIHQAARNRVTKFQQEYLRWLVSGLNEFDNLLYEVSNETHPSSTEWQYDVIRFVKEVEGGLPNQHPVGMTYQNRRGKNQTLFDSPADWVSPNSEGGFRDDPPDQKGTKVVLSDTDHLWGIGGDATCVWKTFTRGLNPIFMDTYEGKVLGKVRPQDDGPRQAMGQVLRLSRTINLSKSTPASDLASTGYCLAETGVSYIVFAPEGGEFSVDLSAASGDFPALWIDPVAGTRAPAGQAVGGVRQKFSAPSDTAVVLFLKRSSPP
jgi:hypothetical protein